MWENIEKDSSFLQKSHVIHPKIVGLVGSDLMIQCLGCLDGPQAIQSKLAITQDALNATSARPGSGCGTRPGRELYTSVLDFGHMIQLALM